ncbi:(2Fe-2S)-binding protein [Enhygromyxa salina]|uniref:4-hydroxybenzoyl-CoA reductase subunit gamma n=1 Tax=Enhygromyxa salina TaxID=215803 RepID=A0A2S9YXI1_9BACT|nr:2Fe-2S iron-sulfur cluster-binding protein [Enhygromyxa salina]PRQ09805.1 4-hydroxybenzoyl-CoA reductase subunit gamma [Enhygromyxa salina]
MSKRDAPEHDETRGLTRRGLFRSIGAATLVAGCTTDDPSVHPEQAPTPDVDGAIGLTPTPLEFVLDGQPQKLEVEARTTLLDLLRLDLDRTGTKVVCDRGACGACMVLVDEVPRNSCMLLALDVAGASITTVAGLGKSSQLSALQLAFVEHDAMQCGFCTSGMLISSSALLRRSAGQPLERAQVEDAIAGNLCRCGTYPHVVDAVLSVANGPGAARRGSELLRAKKGGA